MHGLILMFAMEELIVIAIVKQIFWQHIFEGCITYVAIASTMQAAESVDSFLTVESVGSEISACRFPQ